MASQRYTRVVMIKHTFNHACIASYCKEFYSSTSLLAAPAKLGELDSEEQLVCQSGYRYLL